MKRSKRALASVVGVAFAAILAPAPGFAQADPLDGKTFVGDIVERGSQRGDRSEFTFRNGMFRSSACGAYGFSDAPYKLVSQGESIAFEVETVSADYGRQTWKGTVRANTLEGTAVWYPKRSWYRPDPSPVERVVKASLR